MTKLYIVRNDGPRAPMVREYDTEANKSYQYRKGYFSGLTLQTYGYGNELGKTSDVLNRAYEIGYAAGREQHNRDVLQASGKNLQIVVALVA